ncbi:hypothetical protein Tco_1069243 [Tanacetum coccineum]|uniref:Uncharacterized protein n=1 Tax=Tanacetum coccineum TaxID=301880 RepID=A0ABQ5HI15_9ASTR
MWVFEILVPPFGSLDWQGPDVTPWICLGKTDVWVSHVLMSNYVISDYWKHMGCKMKTTDEEDEDEVMDHQGDEVMTTKDVWTCYFIQGTFPVGQSLFHLG